MFVKNPIIVLNARSPEASTLRELVLSASSPRSTWLISERGSVVVLSSNSLCFLTKLSFVYILSSGMLFEVFSSQILPLTVVNVLSRNDSLVHSRIWECPVKIINIITIIKENLNLFLSTLNVLYTK